MIATGPKPPLSFNSSNDEAPIKLDIGGGMGEQRFRLYATAARFWGQRWVSKVTTKASILL